MKKQFNLNQPISKKLTEKIIKDPVLRKEIGRKSHYWFFHLYFGPYVKYETAPFQKEMFAITEDEKIRHAVIVAFRGSAKSTIMTMSYPIWSILGDQKKKFILILSQTQQQAKLHLTNIKRELESNEVLRKDLGPFQEESEEWGSVSLVIPRYNARITAASSEQSIRGIRHGSHRPDLIIADDVEDLNSVKTKEGRDKTYSWLTGEVIPSGDKGTKVIMIGNLLHEDSLLMRLKQDIEEERIDGTFQAYPLKDANDQVLWPGKFKCEKDIMDLKKTIGSEKSWQREIMLKIIADEDQVVRREWIRYYDDFPEKGSGAEYRFTGTGVDLAISLRDTADFTAMVTARVYGYRENMKIYILPNPVNERLDFPATLARAKRVAETLAFGNERSFLYIEEVGYQAALIGQLKKDGYNAEGVKVHSQDKRARLALITHLIESGKVLFPRKGAEKLIEQLVYFGVEKHDDLSDAFTILLHKLEESDKQRCEIFFLGRDHDDQWDNWDDNGYLSAKNDWPYGTYTFKNRK